MKILTVTNYYPPYFIGGYEIACKETMDFLKDKGHDVMVITSDYIKNEDEDKNIIRKMKYSKPSRIQKKINEYKNYKILQKHIQQFKPDLVYFWSLRGLGINMIKAVEEKSIPKVFEIGDFWMYGYTQPSFKKKIISLLPFIGRKKLNISPAICVSKWVQKEMKTVYNSEITYVSPNATFIPKVVLQKTSPIKFIFIGRLDKAKGLDIAIEALLKFAKKYPESPFTFDIYGNGDAHFIQECKLLCTPIQSKVNFKGQVNLKREMYTDASILLMPTRVREAFGLVIIEAMAYKCAVIATNAYGPSEIITHEENGLLFKPEDYNDLFHNIEKLYFDRGLLKRLQDNGYNDVSKNYSLTSVKSKVEKILLDIAGFKRKDHNDFEAPNSNRESLQLLQENTYDYMLKKCSLASVK
ncbi:Glycosyltransferase [hydrothermal vent metagenome]|uniref:Glycosyltransferase n=1 Tax=hydrothermal vent metagenome TaxID=652676 RepID=A0A1W1CW08_9ZZZZ